MQASKNTAFVQNQLPWIIAATAFALFLVTLNRWISLASLPSVALLTDPLAPPPLYAPLHFLLTYPIRWLPSALQIPALNVFAATCAALTLALLARSVALLPHDRTRDQRHRQRSETALLTLPTAWIPPLFAAAVCALYFSFWEHAIAGTGEMLDLLLLAYIVRCLLEFRLDERDSWLVRMALVYGTACANNYAMIPFAPILLIALIWICGRHFFQLRFIVRLAAWTLAGLSFYLLLPLFTVLSQNTDLGFWQALRSQITFQKQAILAVPRYIVLFGSLTSILPLLFIGIRWPSTFGDISAAGNFLTNLMFRVVHALFLAACLWVAFDAPFNPRVLLEVRVLRDLPHTPIAIPFLTLHYLGALCVGYFIGYFLLLTTKSEERVRHRPAPLTRLARQSGFALLVLVVLGVPAALAFKNLPAIRANNGTILRNFTERMVTQLPDRDTMLLSDSPHIAALVQAWFHQRPSNTRHLILNSRSLPHPIYQKALHRQFPDLWPEPPATDLKGVRLNPTFVLHQVIDVASRLPAYYLHPSFGYFFEDFFLEPDQLICRLRIYDPDQIYPPLLQPGIIESNQSFWTSIVPDLQHLVTLVNQHIPDARSAGNWYSRALVHWGVQLQFANRLPEAAAAFQTALDLNPDNLVARINLEFNQSLQQGQPKRVQLGQSTEDQFGPKYRTWDSLLSANGPVDEPGFCFRIGQLMVNQQLFRQAAHHFQRTFQLEPTNLPARFWLSSLYLSAGFPNLALEIVPEIRAQEPSPTELSEVARIEAMAQLALGETDAAEAALVQARRQFPTSERLLLAQADLYLATGQHDKAARTLDEHLQIDPGNTRALLNKAVLSIQDQKLDQAQATLDNLLRRDPNHIQALLTQSALQIQQNRFQDALRTVNHVLELAPNNQAALMNRAIARLQDGQLDDARLDYLALHQMFPKLHTVHFGLGEIARRQNDRATAVQFYSLYLEHAPPDTEEARQVQQYLDTFQQN